MKSVRPFFTIAAIAFTATLAGCSSIIPTPVEPPTSLSSKAVLLDESELVIEAGFDASNLFVLRSLETGSQDLPAGKTFRNLSVTAATVGDALTLLAKSAGMQLVFNSSTPIAGPVLQNVAGTLPEVLDTLAKAYGIHWHVDGQQLVISQEAQYILQLPPLLAPDSLTATVSTLKQLGARDVYLNTVDQTVVLRADGNVHKKLVGYLDHVRAHRSMIVYDIDVWQVTLSSENQRGIDWSSLSWTYAKGALNAVNGTPGAIAGFGLTIAKDKVDLKLLANWLQTQGSLKSISRPRLAVMSGSKGAFNVGQTTAYVSSVGTTTNGTTSQTTTSTATIQTGLQLAVSGDVQDNTILSRVQVNLSDLLSMKTFKSADTEIALPQTATRQLETTIRARPGDTVLLGGITSGTDTTETTTSLLARNAKDSQQRSELVIAIRPRIIKFTGKSATSATKTAQEVAPVSSTNHQANQ